MTRYNLRLSDCELIGYGVDTKVKLEYKLSDTLGKTKAVSSLDDVNTLLNHQDAEINKLIDENKILKELLYHAMLTIIWEYSSNCQDDEEEWIEVFENGSIEDIVKFCRPNAN